jgi:hypothetical protein
MTPQRTLESTGNYYAGRTASGCVLCRTQGGQDLNGELVRRSLGALRLPLPLR